MYKYNNTPQTRSSFITLTTERIDEYRFYENNFKLILDQLTIYNAASFKLWERSCITEVSEDSFFKTETEDETRHGLNLEIETRDETFP